MKNVERGTRRTGVVDCMRRPTASYHYAIHLDRKNRYRDFCFEIRKTEKPGVNDVGN